MSVYRVCCAHCSECCREGEAPETSGRAGADWAQVRGEHGWVCPRATEELRNLHDIKVSLGVRADLAET